MSLNPRITQIELGIEEMKPYTIYPLSLAGEFKVSDIIAKAASRISEISDNGNEVVIIKESIGVIKENLVIILEMVTKKTNRPNLEEIDNVQFSELAELIFEMNFTGAVKNVQSLIKRTKDLFLSTGQSQQSSEAPATE